MNENTPTVKSTNTLRTDESVREALNRAAREGKIDGAQMLDIFWFHGYALENHLSNEDAGKLIGYSKACVSTLFSGTYNSADWSPVVQAIHQLRQREFKKARSLDVGFIETETSKIIFKTCDNALYDGMPAFIYGASQLGKTRSLLEYVRRCNSSAIKYFRCRSGMTHLRFAKKFAESCHLRGINDKSGSELIDGVARSLDPSCLVIIDEFHLCFETVRQDASKRLIEYIREIYDLSHCGLVLCSTKVGLADLEDGPNRLLFDQLRRRGIVKVVLPDVPFLKDINSFARAYGLPLPSGDTLRYIKNLLQLRGLGVFLAYLAKAESRVAIANEKARTDGENETQLSWDFFLATARGYESLSNIKADF